MVQTDHTSQKMAIGSSSTSFAHSAMLDDQESAEELAGPESIAFDDVLKAIGQSSVYQVLTSLVLMSFMVPYGMAWLNYVFIGYEPHHVCAKTNETSFLYQHSLLNDTTAEVIYETCHIRVTSNKTGSPEDVIVTGCIEGHDFVGGPSVSLKTEWGLVCEKSGMAELFMTLFNLGMAFGSLVIQPMADRFGRKKIVVICSACSILFEFLVTFSPTINVAIVLKTLSGVFIQNLSPLCNAYGQELIPTNSRRVYGVGIVVIWTVGLLYLGGVAYALQSSGWRNLQLFTSLTGIPPLLSIFFIHESLAWLLAEGKHTRALEIIEHKCKKTGADYKAARDAYNLCVLRAKKSKENKHKTAVAKYELKDMFLHPKLLMTNSVLALAYFTHNITFTGLYLTGATFNVNHYLMFLILAATEIPTSLLCFVLTKRIGRITIVIIFLSMTAVCLFISTLLVGLVSTPSVHIDNASTAFFILGKFGINLSFTCLFAFTPEFYPTTLRSFGYGIGIFTARVGGMVSPFLFPLFQIASWAPGTILTALCVFTIGVYPLLPETKGRELPATKEAFEALFDKREKKKEKKRPMIVINAELSKTMESTIRF